MSKAFYKSLEYRRKQSAITRTNWQEGVFDFKRNREIRTCAREGCNNKFEVKPSDPKRYCSHSCAAKVNNINRGPLSSKTKEKISKALKGRKGLNLNAGKILVPRVKVVCANPKCNKVFYRERWRNKKFCSNNCAMQVIGGRPTSPKASRGKAGIRKDISPKIYFYSRWEANFARLLNFFDIDWIYQFKTFDLVSQNYTPDFYLPDYDLYIEIKNFLGEYSKDRHEKFINLYPKLDLLLLLKRDYLVLQNKYSHLIRKWEYRNS